MGEKEGSLAHKSVEGCGGHLLFIAPHLRTSIRSIQMDSVVKHIVPVLTVIQYRTVCDGGIQYMYVVRTCTLCTYACKLQYATIYTIIP